MVDENFQGNRQKVECSKCNTFVHIHSCDKNVTKRKGIAVIPDIYICFLCKSPPPGKRGRRKGGKK